MTFLIADDNLQVRQSIKRFIAVKIPNHHTYLEATDGTEAVTLFERSSPDFVLMDIEMDGLTAMKLIREKHPAARIIIVTSYDDTAYRRAARTGGAYGYVMKDHLDDIQEIVSGPGE
jgi:DNA-binding NarL/FixJ family response regulator